MDVLPPDGSEARDNVIEIPQLRHPVALQAFNSMQTTNQSQSIVMMGVSGSGKSETAKSILKCLVNIAEKPTDIQDLSEMILASNRILEAFGNARTTLNPNSSRFCKLLKLSYHEDFICGAQFQTSNGLIDRARVNSQSHGGERSYHVFYYLIAGTTPQEKEKYKLKNSSKDYRFLKQGDVQGPDDFILFDQLKRDMVLVGFNEYELDQIYRVISGILCLGNIDIDEKAQTNEPLFDLAELWDLLQDTIKNALLTQHCGGPGGPQWKEKMQKPECLENRDTFAIHTYMNLFDWIVSRINQKLGRAIPEQKFIGIFDFPGFENTAYNKFEQFCINYADEKLHHVYVRKTVTHHFQNYSTCLEMIESKKGGIITILEVSGGVIQDLHNGFVGRLHSQHSKNTCYIHDPKEKHSFSIVHHMEPVLYREVDNFVIQNKPEWRLPSSVLGRSPFEIRGVVKTSKGVPILRALFENPEEREEDKNLFAPRWDWTGTSLNDVHYDLHPLIHQYCLAAMEVKSDPSLLFGSLATANAKKPPVEAMPNKIPGADPMPWIAGPIPVPAPPHRLPAFSWGWAPDEPSRRHVCSRLMIDINGLLLTLSKPSQIHFIKCLKDESSGSPSWSHQVETVTVAKTPYAQTTPTASPIKRSDFDYFIPFDKFLLQERNFMKQNNLPQDKNGILELFLRIDPPGRRTRWHLCLEILELLQGDWSSLKFDGRSKNFKGRW